MAKKTPPVAQLIKQSTQQKKRVLIGTPALDGRVDAWFCFALHELAKLAQQNNIETNIILLSYESILPMARNEILTTAINEEFDMLIFIDSDVYCNPQSLIDIIQDNRDVIAIPTVKKSDVENYDITLTEDKPDLESNWIQANRVSTSCLKLSKKVLTTLANNSNQIEFRGKPLYNICQYDFIGEAFMGEDIYLCDKIKRLGFNIWVNIESTCKHIGPKIYSGDCKNLLHNYFLSTKI